MREFLVYERLGMLLWKIQEDPLQRYNFVTNVVLK